MLGLPRKALAAAGCSRVFARRAIMNSVLSSFRFFTDQPWTIPLIGLLVAFLAFLVGRRWFVAQPAPKPEQPAEDEAVNLLQTATRHPPPPERRVCPRRKGG